MYTSKKRENFSRHICGHCGKRRFTEGMVEFPIPNKNTETTFFCKGYWQNSPCEEAGVKKLFERRKYLLAETKSVTEAIKLLRQMEIR